MYAFYSIMFVGVYPVMELCQYMRYNATPKCGAVNVFVIYIFALSRILGAFPICRKSVANPLEKSKKTRVQFDYWQTQQKDVRKHDNNN